MKSYLALILLSSYYNPIVNGAFEPANPVKIKWVWVNSTVLGDKVAANVAHYLEPAGFGGIDVTYYLCRAPRQDFLVPGKQIGRYCYIIGYETRHSVFQVPEIPLATTSWIPLAPSGGQRPLPSKSIIGGSHWDRVVNGYICRGYVRNTYVVPGSYHPESQRCYIPFRDNELPWTGHTEILSVNAYGTVLGLTDNYCQKTN